jgi:hypothetical protein
MWIGLIFGGLVLGMGAAIGLAMYLATRKVPDEPAVQASSTTVDAEEEQNLEAPPADPPGPPPTSRPGDAPLPPAHNSSQPKPSQAAWLPPAEQDKVNKAIDRGIAHLKKTQGREGIWGPREGMTALPGLTLLECGVPADDEHVQKAAQHTRKAIPKLNQTYDLALSILFLDRLGDPRDEALIQTCAMRLVAGQTDAGGWHYVCPTLTSPQEGDLLLALEQTRPTSGLDLFVQGPDGSTPPGFVAQGPVAPLGKTIQEGSVESKLLPQGSLAPLPGKPAPKGSPDPETARTTLSRLPANLRKLAALQPPQQAHKLPPRDASDNSNTQFAILGLWAASRHGLSLERSLALVSQRFRKSQAHKGGWGYQYAVPTADAHVTPAMTGAGLLGLAVGHGLAADHSSRRGQAVHVEDPAVEKGFTVLSQAIGMPLGHKRPRGRKPVPINFYLMWSTERVGVLYERRRINGKDWYAWGAEVLLDFQNVDGSWPHGSYPGAVPVADTCFALLFLKRANLAKDLTQKLEFFIDSGKGLQGP